MRASSRCGCAPRAWTRCGPGRVGVKGKGPERVKIAGADPRAWAAGVVSALADARDDSEKRDAVGDIREALGSLPGFMGFRRVPAWGPLIRDLAGAQSDAEAGRLLRDAVVWCLPMAGHRHGPAPSAVLWRDTPGKGGDRGADGAVLDRGGVALLGGAGGVGKSFLALRWMLAGCNAGAGESGAACGLAVRGGPALYVTYGQRGSRVAYE